jgi:hypothetical protein
LSKAELNSRLVPEVALVVVAMRKVVAKARLIQCKCHCSKQQNDPENYAILIFI